MAKPKFYNPPGLSKPPGYSHVVEVTGPARMIYFAGQLGLDTRAMSSARPAISAPRRRRLSRI